MTMEKLIKELELLTDSCDSNYALEMNGYNRGVLDALKVVNKYFALSDVSSLLKAEREDTKEEIREWLRSEDFEGLAERL